MINLLLTVLYIVALLIAWTLYLDPGVSAAIASNLLL